MKYLIVFISLAILKLCLYSYLILSSNRLYFSGNDADYYEAYALGAELAVSSIWPIILRLMNEIGFYSRDWIGFVFMLLAFLVIPWMSGRLTQIKGAPDHKAFWIACLIVSCYPTLYYYSLDIYRDVLMLFIFLNATLIVKLVIESGAFFDKLIFSLMVFAFSGLLYGFRDYLGLSFIISFMCFWLVDIRRCSLLVWTVIGLFSLNTMFFLGVFDSVMAYRALFDSVNGGTNLGLRFDSALYFIPVFLKSFIFQMLGFYLVNEMAVIAFFLESVPFALFLIYLIRNRNYSDGLVSFLMVFFMIYSVIWLLGNDNLGTAMRLRMYNYIAVFIACTIVWQRKRFIANKINIKCERQS